MEANPSDPVALAERIVALLGGARRSTTYKYALLLALIECCAEHFDRAGRAPDTLLTVELAAKVIDLYWRHAAPYAIDADSAHVLRQGNGRGGAGAQIVDEIARFRREHSALASPWRAQREAPIEWDRLLRLVEWKLVEMPLPRLQRLDGIEERFLYEIGWDEDVRQADVRRAQAFGDGPFDNRVHLRPGVGASLLRLRTMLRPLIERFWTQQVAAMNDFPSHRLEAFLFGADRTSLQPVAEPLRELQRNRCFYCDGSLGRGDARALAVDHFVPWSRCNDDSLDNLVVAHDRCNSEKSDFLASVEHLARWTERCTSDAALSSIASSLGWRRDAPRSRSLARASYLTLPPGTPLWRYGRRFEPLAREPVELLLARD